MINIYDLLYEICESEDVYNPDCELLESGILDSYAFIELFSRLEDYNIYLEPTRIDRKQLKTPKSIENLIINYKVKHEKE